MKKVLLLGGSYFQVPSILTSVKLGYHTITCDYSPENPGHKFAHEYHNVSTTDKKAVLNLAKKLNIDAIVCYASDPAALTAAYVAEKLGLPTNPYSSVKILTNKDLFRRFLTQNGFNSPLAKSYLDSDEVDISKFKLPVVVKPTDSSGSKGVSIVKEKKQLNLAIKNALQFSRGGRFIIEEFVDKFLYQIGGDGFSVNGRLVFRCFGNGHFEPFGLVPYGSSYPYILNRQVGSKIHTEIQRLLTLLKMKNGAYNFDIRIDNEWNVYLMEVGPRSGGNLIPQVIKYATGVDMVEYVLKSALGENCDSLKMQNVKGYWAAYIIHSSIGGLYNNILIDERVKNNIVKFDLFIKKRAIIQAFSGSNCSLGAMILKFDSLDEMLTKMDNMSKYLKIKTLKLSD